MRTNDGSWRQWPAMADLGTARRWKLQCARGVWGKEPGSDRDLHWVLVSEGFGSGSEQRAEALHLGSEDDLTSVLVWRSDADVHQAVHAYPSRFTDCANRNFLERQVLEWVSPRGVPAALAALVLLPEVGRLDDDSWLEERQNGAGTRAPLRDLKRPTYFADEHALADLLETGCGDLTGAMSEADLASLYAELMAGNRFVLLPETGTPLSPNALAALLLPLERPLADDLAMASRLPSHRAVFKRFPGDQPQERVRWHLLGRGACPRDMLPGPDHLPGEHQQDLGLVMARALLAGDPAKLSEHPPARRRSVPAPADGALRLRIWGPASSGKTVYLAQLFMKYNHGGDPDWSIHLPQGSAPEQSQVLKDRMHGFLKENRFPEPTSKGTRDEISYLLINEREGQRALIGMEDRAGEEYEVFDKDTAGHLADAHGLLLLLDPRRDRAVQNEEVRRAFLSIQQARADDGKDPRPLAVCVSKCDAYIHTVEDYRCARDRPEVFLRDHISPTIRDALDHDFINYRLFALSAAGLRLGQGAVEPGVLYDEALEARINAEAQPLHLIDPLLWLFKKLRS